MDLEEEIIPKIVNYVSRIRNTFDVDMKRLANYSKRLNNMIESEGLVRALLFSFSKAKVNGIEDLRKKLEQSSSDKKPLEGEGDLWAVVLLVLLENVFCEYDPLKILKEIESNPSKRAEWEFKSKAYLERIARIFEALAN